MSGAGGGGCVIAVADGRAEEIAETMARLYPSAWISRTGVAGVGEKA
ncbi:MAG: hypothetical protein QXJ47_05225 [Candidatus Caldarchaeum sp.]